MLMFATWQGRITLSHKLWRVSFFFLLLLPFLCPASRRYFSQMPTEKTGPATNGGIEREMDSVCLIRHTLWGQYGKLW